MKLTIEALTCKGGTERLEFSRQLNFFHGEMSTGKSSIASLLDYCLGGRLERTPALAAELLSVKMEARIGDVSCVFERVLADIANLRVSWRLSDGNFQSASVPVKAGQSPVIDEDIFGLSDLLLRFLGMAVLRVRKRTSDPDSELVRLSFRDLAEFMYLDQPHLDSDFFLLDLPIRMEKSKDAIHFFVGFMSERLNILQQELQELRSKQRGMREAAERIQEFLQQFEFESVERLDHEIQALESQVSKHSAELANLKRGFAPETTVAEEDQTEMRQLNARVRSLASTNRDITLRLPEQEALIAELISLKFKLSRATSATALLEGVDFDSCPACGTPADKSGVTSGHCYLCKREIAPASAGSTAEIYRQDIDDRIEDLKQSVQRHRRSLQRNESQLQEARRSRSSLEERLAELTTDYETEYAARARSYERRIAGAQARISLLERVKGMPRAVGRIQKDADMLSSKMDEIRRFIEEEEGRLSTAEGNFKALEANYRTLLLAIGFPGVSVRDMVVINRRSLIPEIWTNGDESRKWTFFDAGSGGKKTLLKISFALAIHKTAAERDLPVPPLLIIDSPMKNITPDVNPAIFKSFYLQLYSLLAGPLREWQCVVIDQTYFAPTGSGLDVFEKRMTQHDPEYPPLIRYYVGP
jgi:predicted  nucleic acid-binding Zn-ribbon protein